MANYDRGVYEPSDEVRVFDGSEEEEDVEGSRLPLLIVLALLVLAMFGGVVWLAYSQGVARGRGETPVLTAAAGPERVAPPQGSGGNTVPYQGFKIYEQPAPPDDSADMRRRARQASRRASRLWRKPPNPRRRRPCRRAPAGSAPWRSAQACAAAQARRGAPKPAPAPPSRGSARQAGRRRAAQIGGRPDPAGQFRPPSRPEAAQAGRQAGSGAAGRPGHRRAPPAWRRNGDAGPRQSGCAAATPAAKPAASGGYVLQIGAYKSQADADDRLEGLQGQACRPAVRLFR